MKRMLFAAVVVIASLTFGVASVTASDALPSLALSEQPVATPVKSTVSPYAAVPSTQYVAVPSKVSTTAASPVCDCKNCKCEGPCPSTCDTSLVVATSPGKYYVDGNDLHSHQCPNPSCGKIWTHRSSESGVGDHNCPNCGAYQNIQLNGYAVEGPVRASRIARSGVDVPEGIIKPGEVWEETVPNKSWKLVAAPVVTPNSPPSNPLMGDCPNGQCYRTTRNGITYYSAGPSCANGSCSGGSCASGSCSTGYSQGAASGFASGTGFRPVRGLIQWLKDRPRLFNGRFRGGCCGG